MTPLLRLRLTGAALLFLLLGGCATETIRGQLNYDLRPEGARAAVVWPPAPATPRYRYLGELVGQPNFLQTEETKDSLKTAFHWLVGLFETSTPLMLQRPQHGTVSDSGRIYVVDSGRKAVLGFDPNPPADDDSKEEGGHLLIWDMAAQNRRFEAPVAVAEVWNGDIAVSDALLGAVVRLNNKGEPIGHLGADRLKRPTGLAFDRERGLLFVADTVANDIKVFDGSGNVVNTFGSPGEDKGQFNAPTHLAFSGRQLYVSDTLNSRIQVFDRDGRYVRDIGERGLYVGNLTRPKGVAIGDAGIIYIVESYFNHLLVYNEPGQLLLGITGNGLQGDKFLLPSGVWTDRQGRLYIADMFNGRVVMFQALDHQKAGTPAVGLTHQDTPTQALRPAPRP